MCNCLSPHAKEMWLRGWFAERDTPQKMFEATRRETEYDLRLAGFRDDEVAEMMREWEAHYRARHPDLAEVKP